MPSGPGFEPGAAAPTPNLSDEVALVCQEAAAQAEAELRPFLDELHARPTSMTGGHVQPAEGWAWLARGGRSHDR